MFRESPENLRKDVGPWRFSATRLLHHVLMRQQIYIRDLKLQFFTIKENKLKVSRK